MKLYSIAHSPYAARVRIQIAAGELPVEIVTPESFRTPAYKKINPTGKVPALDTGEMVIPESAVIMDYLEEMFPDRPLRPADLRGRTLVNLFSRVPDTYLAPALFALFNLLFFPAQKNVDSEKAAEQLTALKAQLQLIEQLFVTYGRAGHNTLDLADCYLAPVMFFVFGVAGRFDEKNPLADCAHLQDWWQWANCNEHISGVLQEMTVGFKTFMATIKA